MYRRVMRLVSACLMLSCFILAPLGEARAVARYSGELFGDMICDCAEEMNKSDFEALLISKSLKSRAKQIVLSVKQPNMSDYELALALNDWLVDNTRYKSHETGALSVLNNGFASCSGYANAYCALLQAADIGHRRIVGKSFRFDHVWNLVKMDGEWYHVDVRMNDSTHSHLYFGLTHDAISVNHQSFSKSKTCDAFECNFSYKNGVYDDTLAFINDAIKDNFSKGIPAFIINLTSSDCPETLQNPVQRAMISRIIESKQYEFMGKMQSVKLSTLQDGIALHIETPFTKISRVTLDTHKVKLNIQDLSAAPVTYQLSASVTPENASNPIVFWKSRNEKVAIVDQNGLVTIVGYGKAKIQALAEDGSKKIDTCEFTVKKK